ncbi:MAG TPA: S49 family peptidase, partial [Gemmataceae bacterium]
PPPPAEPPAVIPVRHLPPAVFGQRPRGGGCLAVLLIGSLILNVLLALLLLGRDGGERRLRERFFFGTEGATDKVAVVRIDGVLMEGMIDYELKQIERAAKDDDVKAVVVRIDSPGGTISASDELHKRLAWLRDGTSPLYQGRPKPLVASMGSVAASGGYYVAMPASPVLAEPTTLTGSVGVYAAFPNVSELGEKIGFRMELIKAGRIKASGSPFHEMTPQERQPWQEMVDQAYDRFLEVVTAGRPGLADRDAWTEPLFEKQVPLRDARGEVVRSWFTGEPVQVPYSRYRADGGVFTAADAEKYGLIDQLGDLPDAARLAAQAAGLTEYRVVVYDRPYSFFGELIGMRADSGGVGPEQLAAGAVPRLWYLTPQADLAGLFATLSAGAKP